MTAIDIFGGGGGLIPSGKPPRAIVKAAHDMVYQGYLDTVQLQVQTGLAQARIQAISSNADRALSEVVYLTQRTQQYLEHCPQASDGLAAVYQATVLALSNEVNFGVRA